jgi:protein arginine N-methyltransferase 1
MREKFIYRASLAPLRGMTVLEFHETLLSDGVGQEAFRNALAVSVRGGKTVLDIGTGTGIHAMFACQSGASRVYAVEQSSIIGLAEAICRSNGFDDRISFFHASIEDVELPEKVDVISIHLGLGETLGLLSEVRDRNLKKGGLTIPAGARLFCAPIESVQAYEKIRFWERAHHGLDFSQVRHVAENSTYPWRIHSPELLADGVLLAEFDFVEIKEAAFSQTAKAEIVRDGTLHGIGIWYVENLGHDISISTAPPCDLPRHLWLNHFFPANCPIDVKRGDVATISVQTGVGGWGHLWNWQIIVEDSRSQERYRSIHSTLSGQVPSHEVVRKRSPSYTPQLKSSGFATHFVLTACAEGKTLDFIEKAVFLKFPEFFRNRGEAIMFVADTIARYTL